MANNEWNFDDLVEEDDQLESAEDRRLSRECKIFLVDGSESMLSNTCFVTAMKAIRETLCKECVGSQKDFSAVVVMNTNETSNDHGFDHIFTLQDVGLPGAEKVKEIEAFCDQDTVESAFKDKFGGSGECNWDEALWLASTLLSNNSTKFGTKRIFIFTDCDQPFETGQTDSSRRIIQKWKDLKDQEVAINLLPLTPSFDGGKFWNLIDGGDYSTESQAKTMEDLQNVVRRKEYKKRATGNIPFTLGEGVEISVGMFNLIAPAKVPPAIHLDRKSNEEVTTHTSYFNQETGEKLLDRDMQKYQVYGAMKIAMEADEVESLRRLTAPGLTLLGFKPISFLKPHHHYKPPMFLYPDEKQVKGSTKLFRALLDRCVARKVMAICRVTPRRNMPPRVVALLPQASEQRDDREDKDPPGFHAIFLPYAEDFRSLSKLTGVKRPQANEHQVEKALEVIEHMKLKDFTATAVHNPVLAKHYNAVEAMALEKEMGPLDTTDDTKPDVERIERKAGDALQEFRDAVFPEGYNPKRKAPSGSGGGPSKRPKSEKVLVDLETEAKAGRLGKLTVAALKEYSSEAKIRLKATRKAEIIAEIMKHYAV